MRLTTTLLSSTAYLALAAAPAAWADVTPDDVWENTKAYLSAFGGETTGTLATNGDVTTITGMSTSFALPMGLGAIDLSMSDLEMVDNGDGSVTLRYPDGTQIAMNVQIAGQGQAGIKMTLGGGDLDMLATGQPGDVTYEYAIPSYVMKLSDLMVEGAVLDAADMAFLNDAVVEGKIEVRDNVGTMRVFEGDLLEMSLTGGYSGLAYGFEFEGGGVSGFQTGSAGKSQSDLTMKLPRDGVAVMAIPAALEAGMQMVMNTTTASSSSNEEMTINGNVVSYSRDSSGPVEAELTFDKSGLAISASMERFELETLDTSMPFPIEAKLEALSGTLELPVTGSPDPQPFVYDFALNGVTVSDRIWNLFDPAGGLPRDPATVRLATSGEMGTTMDLLDIPALMALEQSNKNPFSIHAMTLNDLYVDAVGAKLSGTGDFTFDMDDLDTFDGIPAPTGVLDMQIVGANGLIDKMIEMGLVESEEAMGARMMLGIFARPGDAEDSLVSKIEIDGASGAIMANGQRMR